MKKTRLLSIFLSFLLVFYLAVPAFSTEDPETETHDPSITAPTVQNTDDLDPSVTTETPTGFEIPAPLAEYDFPCWFIAHAGAGALVELNTHAIIYGVELDKQIYPASLTKIMTCMLALKHGNLDDMVTVSASCFDDLNIYGSTAGLMEGERLTLREMLYCVMVSSANEACNAVAEYIAGDRERFVDMMNQQAAELGMRSTHYANTHGLHDDNHYTSARDLATLACWAWQNPQFRQFATTSEYTLPATNLSEERYLVSTNLLTLNEEGNRYYYSKASGIKTGFTTPAGGCLIATASDGELSFLSVLTGCATVIDNDGSEIERRFSETKRLMEFAFDNYAMVQVLTSTAMLDQPEVKNAEGRNNVVVHARESTTVLLPDDCEPENITMSIKYDNPGGLTAPLAEGQKVGTVTAMYNGIPLATTDLVTLTAVEEAKPVIIPQKIETSSAILQGILRFWYLTLPALLILILLILLFIVRGINTRKAKKRAARRRAAAAARRRQQR